MVISTYTLEGKTVNKTDNGTFWRLIHDGSDVIALFEASGITETINTLYIAATEDECQAEIARLGLTPLPDPEYPE